VKTRKSVVITALVLVALIIATGVIFAQGTGAVNQGTNSTAEGNFSTVSGGRFNTARGEFSTIGGGGGNSEDAGNTALSEFSTISGGRNNNIGTEGDLSTIGGGLGNDANAFGATIGGGNSNTATGESSTIGGGARNHVLTAGSTVSGGIENLADGDSSTVGGGSGNSAEGTFSTVSGGNQNHATSASSTVGGGGFNTASGQDSTIGGGGGNTASGSGSTVPGDASNIADGDFSFAAGRQAQANHNGTFIWADATTLEEFFTSTGENQFLIRASGGVGIDTNSPNQLIVVGDDLGGALPGNRVTIGNPGTPGPDGRSGLNLGEDLDQRAFILWQNDGNYLQLGVRNGDIQEQNALVVKDRRVGIGTSNPTQRLHVNGNVRANQFLTNSSQRWKTNIQTIEGALEKVQGLRGVSYDWKVDGKHDIGLIAEEVGKVIPEVVVHEANGKDAIGVDYARLAPVLIEAIKEQQQLLEDRGAQITAQQEQIKAHEQQIAALQENNHKLEARMTTLEGSVGAKGAQTGLLPFSASVMWMLAAGGLGLVLAVPGLVLGYHRIRRDE
jgi:Chaperone of endosialidase